MYPAIAKSAEENIFLNQVFKERYQITNLFSETSLAYYFHIKDISLLESEASESDSSFLLCLLKPSLSHHPHIPKLVLQVLHHSHINRGITLLDTGYGSEGTWYVAAYPHGITLSTRIMNAGRQGVLTSTCTSIMEHIITALEELPSETPYGYLEPGAILFPSNSNSCIVLDFPIAMSVKLLQDHRGKVNSDPIILNSDYLSPDVSLGKSPTPEDDVFSLAAITYHLLNGHTPFLNKSSVEAGLEQLSPPPILKLSKERWQVVQQGLSYLRQQRQSSVQEFLYQLNKQQKDHFAKLPKRKYLIYSGVIISCTLLASNYFQSSSSKRNTTIVDLAKEHQATTDIHLIETEPVNFIAEDKKTQADVPPPEISFEFEQQLTEKQPPKTEQQHLEAEQRRAEQQRLEA
ncbi:MAG TPA: hypothetical protein PLB10_16475, partial [Thiolinea sp.]|nr:hypothetical protein [Thiolinea sp.]